MQDFPYDIWQVIASHIPERRLRALYGVNRPLFLASMNARYRTISFSSIQDKRLVQNLVRLRDPFVVKRVRSLVLGPSLAEELFESRGRWAKPQNLLLRMRNAPGYFKQGISSGDLIEKMLSVVRVTELTIDSVSDTLFPIVRAILVSSGTSLLKLKIFLAYAFVLSFLPLEHELPNLMHFDVTLEERRSYTLSYFNLTTRGGDRERREREEGRD